MWIAQKHTIDTCNMVHLTVAVFAGLILVLLEPLSTWSAHKLHVGMEVACTLQALLNMVWHLTRYVIVSVILSNCSGGIPSLKAACRYIVCPWEPPNPHPAAVPDIVTQCKIQQGQSEPAYLH